MLEQLRQDYKNLGFNDEQVAILVEQYLEKPKEVYGEGEYAQNNNRSCKIAEIESNLDNFDLIDVLLDEQEIEVY